MKTWILEGLPMGQKATFLRAGTLRMSKITETEESGYTLITEESDGNVRREFPPSLSECENFRKQSANFRNRSVN